MEILSIVKNGLIAGIPIAIVCILVILARANTIKDLREENPAAAGFTGESLVSWLASWVAISLVFGVVAAWTYSFASSRWGWGPVEFLAGAAVVALALSVLLFVRLYDGETHAFKVEYTSLNFAFAIGFGVLVPKLVG